MVQDFTPLFRSIWSDDDWRALSVDGQWTYAMLMSHPDRNYAGVLPVTKRRWVRLAAGMTMQRLDATLAELDSAGFIVLDEDTEEVLVRAYIRRTKVFTHIRMMANALRESTEVESERIRSALGQEFVRLPRLAVPARTERNGRMVDEAVSIQQRLDEVASMLCDAPPDPPSQGAVTKERHGMPHGIGHGIGHPPVVGAGAVAGAGAGAVGGSCTSTENESLESNAHGRPLTGLCREHPGHPSRNCSGCAADRKAAS